MMQSYQGEIQTVIQANGKNNIQKMHWDADYDGDKANISLDIEKNHKAKHYDVQLNNEDLAEMLNMRSINTPLIKRLERDFPRKKRLTKRKYPIIELNDEVSAEKSLIPDLAIPKRKGRTKHRRSKRSSSSSYSKSFA
jgi:hypothetical protein